MRDALTNRLAAIRRKIQLERLIKGLALLAGAFVLGSILSTYVLARQNFSDEALFWIRLAGGGLILFLFFYYLFRPLARRPSERQVARFLEERHPGLNDTVSTAVEVGQPGSRVHPQIRNLIRKDARMRLDKHPQPRFYAPQTSMFSLLTALASLLLFSYLFMGGSDAYRYGMNKLFSGWFDQDQAPLYSIAVTPGNTTVGKRSDVEVGAELHGFDAEEVRLFVKYENQPQWEEALMRPSIGGTPFAFLLLDLRDRMDYYVEAEGIRSDTFQIEVAELPGIKSFAITLEFPRYTGLGNVTQEDQGDIRALIGTRARFDIQTDQPVQNGKIRLEKGGEVVLENAGPQQLTGLLEVKADDFYRIHLQDLQAFWSPASDEYIIEGLQDQPPNVFFTEPGRDRRVTNIEEVFTELEAEDDYGVAELSLRFSVNGDAEQEVKLDYPRGSSSLSSSHTFYLEEFDLKPGDFVSYYAEASDAVTSSTTDIYFFEVEPYDREYSQSQQGASMAGASGQQNLMLSKRQKEIIAATFNLEREKGRYSSADFEENSQTLALVQQRLQSEAHTILERIQRRGALAGDARAKKMAEHINQAIQHMEPAHQKLNKLKPQEALPDEQKSFRELLSAEAQFKEIQVSFAQNASAGGNSSPQELADMVDLELDKKKNQYETLQQNRQLNREQELDETLEKLKELARRQEQQAERQRRAGQSSSSGGGQAQEQMIEELEELARQLERLSRQERDRQLAQVGRELRQAARDLRQSSNQNSQEAQMRAQRALNRLQQAQNSLAGQRQNQLENNLQQLQNTAQGLVRRQEDVVKNVQDLEQRYQNGNGTVDRNFMQDLRKVLRDKSELQSDVQEMEGQLHQAARQMSSKQPGASRQLKQAGLDIRDQRIPEQMQEGSELLSRGWMDMARKREEGVSQELRSLSDKIQQAEQALGPGNQNNPEERLQRALNQTGKLVENLDSLKERAQQQASQQGQPSQSGRQASGANQPSPGSQQPGPVGEASNNTSQAGITQNTQGISPGQVGREWQHRIQEAEHIRELLGDNPELARDVNALAREMRLLDADRLLSDPEEILALKSKIIDGLRQLELEISRALNQDSGLRLRLVNQDEVPPEFRDKVEEYYRSLARRKP
ncbi:MAG: hypothetical protein ACRD1R_01035 [Acidobacteriota bacterium]